jgi:hypothetical protein
MSILKPSWVQVPADLGLYMSSSGPTLGSQAQLHIHTHMGHGPGRDIPPPPPPP